MERDKNREDRIVIDVLADIHDQAEQSLSWYVYLQNRLSFPFKAQWLTQGVVAATNGQEVEVIGMATEAECEKEMMVKIRYQDDSGVDEFAVPLTDIQAIAPDADTAEAIADWRYWIEMNHEL